VPLIVLPPARARHDRRVCVAIVSRFRHWLFPTGQFRRMWTFSGERLGWGHKVELEAEGLLIRLHGFGVCIHPSIALYDNW